MADTSSVSLRELQSHPDEVPLGNNLPAPFTPPLQAERPFQPLPLAVVQAPRFPSQTLLETLPSWGLSSLEEASCPHSGGSTSSDEGSTAVHSGSHASRLTHTEPLPSPRPHPTGVTEFCSPTSARYVPDSFTSLYLSQS